MVPKTLFEKIWDKHVVYAEPDKPDLLYIDLHLIHEVTSPSGVWRNQKVRTHTDVDQLFEWAIGEPRGIRLTINLDLCQIRNDAGDFVHAFKLDEFRKESLQKGLDAIDRIMDKSSYVSAYEEKMPPF